MSNRTIELSEDTVSLALDALRDFIHENKLIMEDEEIKEFEDSIAEIEIALGIR